MFQRAKKAYEKMIDIKSTKGILLAIKEMLENNMDILEKAQELDVKHGGRILPLNTIMNNIVEMSETEEVHKKILEMYRTDDGFIVGSHYEAKGVLGAIYDGNPFVTFDLIIKAIKTHNALILYGYKINLAMNKFLVEIVSRVLEKSGYPKDLIQFTDNPMVFGEVDKLIVIGDRKEQNGYKDDAIKSGYCNYEIYVDKNVDNDLIKRIVNTKLPVKIYSKEPLEVEYILVKDIDEAMSKINNEGSLYSAAIFTNDVKLGEKFLKGVKAKSVFVNASPTMERSLRDIKLTDLLVEKTMFYPSIINFTEKEVSSIKDVKEEIKKNEEAIESNNTDDIINKLEERLRETNKLLNKYTDAFNKSFVARLVTGIKKEDLVSDVKLLDKGEK